jgi:hypothetical protein
MTKSSVVELFLTKESDKKEARLRKALKGEKGEKGERGDKG